MIKTNIRLEIFKILKFIEQHKAALITSLLTGTLVLALFAIQIKQKHNRIAENFYDVEAEHQFLEDKDLLETLNNATTNKAFNEDLEFKEMMRNFKSVSSDDFERTTKALAEAKANAIVEETSHISESFTSTNAYALNTKETEAYKNLQQQLNKRLENKKVAAEHAKRKSTLTYALKGRVMLNYDVPIYLCENGGKIVVNIAVNNHGIVTEASINGSSNSNNQCLVDHAIAYAKDIPFDTSTKTRQIGTITFLFKGKN